jgi:phage tail sheath protein FI
MRKPTAVGASGTPTPPLAMAPVGQLVLCTNYTEFLAAFVDPGSTTTDGGQGLTYLSQAVYGFFQNGGTLCWVVRIEGMNTGDQNGKWNDGDFTAALLSLEAITGVSIVAAPGMMTATAITELQTHCEQTMGDRFAILDAPIGVVLSSDTSKNPVQYPASDYLGLYFPWILVPNPNTQGPATIPVPPSGHIAGIYARVDAQRGVNKAPANEVIFGALGFQFAVGQSQQAPLNFAGVNCLRNLEDANLVWGARTLIADGTWKPMQMKYINARRFLNFLKDSLARGLQWTVFEPNNSTLWATVTRNVTAFLRDLWAQGALLGDTPADAFYVKCDAENNPPTSAEMGTLNVEIGVAIVEPAEFVVISLNNWAGPPQA